MEADVLEVVIGFYFLGGVQNLLYGWSSDFFWRDHYGGTTTCVNAERILPQILGESLSTAKQPSCRCFRTSSAYSWQCQMDVVAELSRFKVAFYLNSEYRLLCAWQSFWGLGQCVDVCDLVCAFVTVHGG